MEKITSPNINKIRPLIHDWLKKQLQPEALEWLQKKIDLIKESNQKKDIFLAFSSVSRFVGKHELRLSIDDFKSAEIIRSGWKPEGWKTDEAARILLILSIPHNYPDFFLTILKQLFETAEVSELRALYLGFPLYPFPEELKPRAIEGFRTNINLVFNAIALNNPYPKEFLDEASWNQMVLKAVFIGSPLYKIEGIDERSNVTLANILSDFAHERWAANRTITPELWRALGPFVDEKFLPDLDKVISTEELIQKKAAGLALSASTYPGAHTLLEKHPAIAEKINQEEINWVDIGKEWEKMIA